MTEFHDEQEIRLEDLFRLLWRRRRLIVAVTMTAVLGVGAHAYLSAPVYESSATLVLTDSRPTLMTMGLELPGPQSMEIEREREYLTSRTLIEQVVKALRLDYQITAHPVELAPALLDFHVPEGMAGQRLRLQVEQGAFRLTGPGGEILLAGPCGRRIEGNRAMIHLAPGADRQGRIHIRRMEFDQATAALRKRVRVSEKSRGSQVLEIRVEDTDPRRAGLIVNTLVGFHIDQIELRLGQRERQKTEFIADQIEEVSRGLARDEHELNRYKQEHGIFLLDVEARGLIEAIAGLEVRRTDLSILRGELEGIQRGLLDQGPGRYLLGDAARRWPALDTLVRQLSGQLVELGGLRGQYTEDHPRIRTLRLGIEESQRAIAAALQNAYTSIGEQLANVQEALKGYEFRLAAMPETEQQLIGLTRRVQVNAELYIYLMKAHEESRIAQAAVVSNLQVLDPGITPRLPIKPRKRLMLVLALMVGGMLGVMIAFGVEAFQGNVTGVEDLERELNLPAVCLVPVVRGREGCRELADPFLLRGSQSPWAEAMRSLRTQIEHEAEGGSVRRLLLTSPLSGEGKTTIGAALGRLLEMAGHRTLLIDGDLRHPRLAGYFDRPVKPGLSDILAGRVVFNQAVLTLEPKLDLLPGGTIEDNPAELLAGHRLPRLLAELEEAYRFIIIDSPACSQFTDATLLSRCADAAYLIVQPYASRRSALWRTRRQLEQMNVPLKGLIANRVPISRREYGYDYNSPNGTRSANRGERLRNYLLG